MHVAGLQFDIVWEDKSANHRLMEAMLDGEALPAGCFVLLPELGDTGFSFDLDTIVDGRSLEWAAAVARQRCVWIQAGDAVRGPDGRGRNRATIVDPEGVARAGYEKIHPFSYGKEALHFGGGDHLVVHRCGDALVAPMICYDLRFPELWRLAARAGAEVFTIGASWPAARQHHWRALLIARAIENQAYVVAVNRVGHDPHIAYAGGSIIVSPTGEVVAEAGDEPAVLRAQLDLLALAPGVPSFPRSGTSSPDFLDRSTFWDR